MTDIRLAYVRLAGARTFALSLGDGKPSFLQGMAAREASTVKKSCDGDCFTIRFCGQPVLSLKLHSDELRDAVEPISSRAPGADAYIASKLPQAVEDLLFTLWYEALAKSHTPDGAPSAKDIVRVANLHSFAMKQRIGARPVGGSDGLIDATGKQLVTFASEYAKLEKEKAYGDRQNKTLWQIICDRSDSNHPKWREHAKADQSDAPDAVLDIVPKRHRFTPNLGPSYFALCHAATRAGISISFDISTNNKTGRLRISPSKRTLLRRRDDGKKLLFSHQSGNRKRRRKQ